MYEYAYILKTKLRSRWLWLDRKNSGHIRHKIDTYTRSMGKGWYILAWRKKFYPLRVFMKRKVKEESAVEVVDAKGELDVHAEALMQKMREHFDKLMQGTQGWINVEKRNPPNDCSVLMAIYDSRPKVNMFFLAIGYRINNLWFYGHDGETIKIGMVTHWMQLPDKPKVEDIW